MNESQAVVASVSNLFQSATASVSKKEKEKDKKDHYPNNMAPAGCLNPSCRM